jgi:hypothetical protein
MVQSSLWLDRARLARALTAAGVRSAGRPSPLVVELRRFGLECQLPTASARPAPRSGVPPLALEGALKHRLADFVEWLLDAARASCAYVLDSDGIPTISRYRTQEADDRVLSVATALLDTLRLVKGPLREEGVNHAAVVLPRCGMVEVVSANTAFGPYFAAWATQEVVDSMVAELIANALRSAIDGTGEA